MAGVQRLFLSILQIDMPPTSSDGLADISTRHPELSVPLDWESELLRITDQDAVDLSLDVIRAHPPRSLTYIALGPLTNLARMMRKDPACVRERIGRIIAMGGALEAPGNVTPVAECGYSLVSKIFHLFSFCSQLLR